MEKLLNVKQAAALLNVSEMTIRRWTNSGQLACFRIGKKKERRFRPSDIQQFIEGKTCFPGTDAPVFGTTVQHVTLGFGEIDVPDGSHLAHFYADVSEALGVQASYVRQGIENGETVLVVSTRSRREKLFSVMEQDGLDIPKLIRQNRLIHSNGKKTPAQMTEYAALAAASSRDRFRLIGDMSWTADKKWSGGDIRTLEENTNARRDPGHLFLCQYGLDEFCGTDIMMALETHSCAIHRGKLRKSFMNDGYPL